jgi:hypothetical protein
MPHDEAYSRDVLDLCVKMVRVSWRSDNIVPIATNGQGRVERIEV